VRAAIGSKIWASQAFDEKRPFPRGELTDSACFQKGARMDSFAALLPTPEYSSMYEAMFVK
jgi:hypothetical protein